MHFYAGPPMHFYSGVDTLSRYDAETRKWTMEKAPVYHIVD